MDSVERLYQARFSDRELKEKDAVWKEICSYLQRQIGETDTVLDIGCGFGEFLRHIKAGKKIGVDQNAGVQPFLSEDTELHTSDSFAFRFLDDESVDVCFTSNFFEHLPDKTAMDQVLHAAYRVLKPGGRFIAIQPNILYAKESYWDFYDHHIPLTHRSCEEGFLKAGFVVSKVVPRFLPYTTKSRIPKIPILVRLYLRFPLAWRFLGKQFLIFGLKPT